MRGTSQDTIAKILGWSLVAIPSALFLAFTAWISSFKMGVSGGVAYAIALAAWVSLLLWRSLRSRR